MIVYVSVRDASHGLAQHEWARLIRQIEGWFAWLADGNNGQVYEAWFSRPDDWWQSACWRVEVADDVINHVKKNLAAVTEHVGFEWVVRLEDTS